MQEGLPLPTREVFPSSGQGFSRLSRKRSAGMGTCQTLGSPDAPAAQLKSETRGTARPEARQVFALDADGASRGEVSHKNAGV